MTALRKQGRQYLTRRRHIRRKVHNVRDSRSRTYDWLVRVVVTTLLITVVFGILAIGAVYPDLYRHVRAWAATAYIPIYATIQSCAALIHRVWIKIMWCVRMSSPCGCGEDLFLRGSSVVLRRAALAMAPPGP